MYLVLSHGYIIYLQILISTVEFKVLTAVVMKSPIFWDITPCSPLKATECSSETSVDFQRARWHYMPKHKTFHSLAFLNKIFNTNLPLKLLKNLSRCYTVQPFFYKFLDASHPLMQECGAGLSQSV
jgi:hypothetical protein